jgi:hypothetical protein
MSAMRACVSGQGDCQGRPQMRSRKGPGDRQQRVGRPPGSPPSAGGRAERAGATLAVALQLGLSERL